MKLILIALVGLAMLGCEKRASTPISPVRHATTAPLAEQTSQPAAQSHAPLRAGDVITVSVTGCYANDLEVVFLRRISPEGFIELPQIDQKIQAAGLSCQALIRYLSKLYGDMPVSVTRPVDQQKQLTLLDALMQSASAPTTQPTSHPAASQTSQADETIKPLPQETLLFDFNELPNPFSSPKKASVSPCKEYGVYLDRRAQSESDVMLHDRRAGKSRRVLGTARNVGFCWIRPASGSKLLLNDYRVSNLTNVHVYDPITATLIDVDKQALSDFDNKGVFDHCHAQAVGQNNDATALVLHLQGWGGNGKDAQYYLVSARDGRILGKGPKYKPTTAPTTQPATLGFTIHLSSWATSLDMDRQGHVTKTWLTRKEEEPPDESMTPADFDAHRSQGILSDTQNTRLIECLNKHEKLLLGLGPQYYGDDKVHRYTSSFYLTVGSRHVRVEYIEEKLPAEAQAAISELKSILSELQLAEDMAAPGAPRVVRPLKAATQSLAAQPATAPAVPSQARK